MSVLTNRDIKRLFILLSCAFFGFIALSQLYFWLSDGSPKAMILLASLLLAASVLISCFLYFHRQQQMIEKAISQINRFVSGDSGARIESGSEGSLYKLFHEVNKLATTLNAQAVREQHSKDFLKNTISDISHQLKTPLAALHIYNGILLDDNEDATVLRDFAAKSEQELDRIEMLVQSLLKITKLDAGTIAIEKRPENMASMMNDIRGNFEIHAHQEQKTITFSGSQDAELMCDKNWIIEAISNVIKNALDHTEAGSDIQVTWTRLPAVTQITVSDNGSGIHPEDIHHIFKRFYRSCFPQDTQGLGLGLPLAKAIVEAHDGNITVDSDLGAGSTFTITFLNLT